MASGANPRGADTELAVPHAHTTSAYVRIGDVIPLTVDGSYSVDEVLRRSVKKANAMSACRPTRHNF